MYKFRIAWPEVNQYHYTINTLCCTFDKIIIAIEAFLRNLAKIGKKQTSQLSPMTGWNRDGQLISILDNERLKRAKYIGISHLHCRWIQQRISFFRLQKHFIFFNPRSPKLKIVTRSPRGGSFGPPLDFAIFWPIFLFVILNESLAQKLFIAKKILKKS